MSARRREIWLLLFKCSSQADESISLSCPAMTTSTVSTRAASPGMSSRRASANAPQISHTCACGNNATLQSSAWASRRSNIFTGDNKMSNCSVKILAYIFSWMYKTLPLVADFPLKKGVKWKSKWKRLLLLFFVWVEGLQWFSTTFLLPECCVNSKMSHNT